MLEIYLGFAAMATTRSSGHEWEADLEEASNNGLKVFRGRGWILLEWYLVSIRKRMV